MRARTSMATALLALCASLSCHSTPAPKHSAVDDPATRDALRAHLSSVRPPMKTVQRALFVRGQDQVSLTMYTDFEEPRSMKLAAVSDLGVTVFQLEATSASVQVLHESSAFPASFLENYLLPDLLAVWAIPPAGECELVHVERGDGVKALAYADGDSRVLGYEAGASGLQQYERTRDGEVLSEIELSQVPAATAGDPQRYKLRITSGVGSYTANLVVSEWTKSDG